MTQKGKKHVLSVRQGATENAEVVTTLLEALPDRGLDRAWSSATNSINTRGPDTWRACVTSRLSAIVAVLSILRSIAVALILIFNYRAGRRRPI